MATGLDRLKHIVVLMMENRSFDHMLGSLKAVNPKIDGLTGAEANPDTTPAQNPVPVKPLAEFQGQLDPDPDHHFPAVDIQIFGGDKSPNRTPNMQGFVKSYFNQRRDVKHSQKIMYYFTRDQLPVLTTLALEFAVFNRWFASIPGPTICNRAFAHYGTSFGRVDLNPLYINEPFKSIYQRLVAAQRTAKVYYYDTTSSTMEVANLLQNQPQVIRHLRPVPAGLQTRPASRLFVYRAELQRPRYRQRRRNRQRSASRPPRAGRRALHRDHLQRDQAESGTVGEHRAADRLRRARRHL